MNVEEMVLRAKQDTGRIFDMMNTCFDKKIETLHEWVVVNCIISDVLNMKKESVSEDMIKTFIDEFNQRVKVK
jgi:hypothetical protein